MGDTFGVSQTVFGKLVAHFTTITYFFQPALYQNGAGKMAVCPLKTVVIAICMIGCQNIITGMKVTIMN